MVLCGLLVMLLKLYLYTKSLNVGYWPVRDKLGSTNSDVDCQIESRFLQVRIHRC